jgi:uncharacterized SAM-binding protein YcdF (DUF218 family)
MNDRVRDLARVLWHYHRLGHTVTPSDAILVLCSHDLRVAGWGAQLYLDGLAPLLIYSGGSGAITRQMWQEPEAEVFARVAREMGVPPAHLLTERRSTNTGENVRFTRELLEARGLQPRSLIVVQKPYMERRSYATVRQVWPEMPVQVTSGDIGMDDYLAGSAAEGMTADDIVSIMVGDLQRIRLYAERGFQIPQEIPDSVWSAYEALVAAGYDRHLVRE